MYKVTITHNDGKRQVIDPFPNKDFDLYVLTRLIDKCEIKSFSMRWSDKEL